MKLELIKFPVQDELTRDLHYVYMASRRMMETPVTAEAQLIFINQMLSVYEDLEDDFYVNQIFAKLIELREYLSIYYELSTEDVGEVLGEVDGNGYSDNGSGNTDGETKDC